MFFDNKIRWPSPFRRRFEHPMLGANYLVHFQMTSVHELSVATFFFMFFFCKLFCAMIKNNKKKKITDVGWCMELNAGVARGVPARNAAHPTSASNRSTCRNSHASAFDTAT